MAALPFVNELRKAGAAGVACLGALLAEADPALACAQFAEGVAL